MPLFSSSLITSTSAADSTPADPVTRSLRVDGSLSYLERATGSTDTTWTISFWAKRADQPDDGNAYMISWAVSGSSTSSTGEGLCFGGSDQGHSYPDYLGLWDGSTLNWSSGVYRDFSAWSHYMISCNSGTATVYVNNEAVISNISSIQALGTVRIGTFSDHPNFEFGGYLADIICIEGTAKADATDFIESNGYGGYKPKEYTGSFGTNGFHIDAQPAHDADLLVSSIDRKDGDTLFADCAGHTITKGGDPEHSIAVGNPFTGDDRAIVFNPSNNDMLEIASSSDFQFGTGDFTIEGWYNFRHLTGDQVICDLRPSNTSDSTRPSFSTAGAGLKMHFAGGNTTLASSGLVIGKWHHIEISRSSNTLYCFIDGTQTYSNTFSNDLNTDCTPHLGSTDTNNQVAFLDGYVFDYHILKGFGRNTSNFTVPTEKSTKDSTYTVLLLQPDKDDTGFDDLSDSDHTITATGSPTRTASTPYDAAAKSTAMYFDGSGDYLNIGTTSDFRTTTNNFTLDFWFKPNGSSTGTVFSNVNDGNVYDGLTANVSSVIVSVSLRDSSSSNNVVSLTYTNDDTDWHHVEVSRTGSTLYLFVDGNLEDSGSISFTPTNSGLVARAGRVYASSYSGSNNYEGYLFDYRWSNSGGHTASFTAPSAPLELNPVYIGGDQSGNKNHFQPTNISTTDVRTDVPTDSFCVMSPVDKGSGVTLSEGNLKAVCDNNWDNVRGTMGATSGKFYYEVIGTIATNGSARWNAGIDINQKCEVDTYNDNTGSIVYSLHDGRIYDGAGSYSSATQGRVTNARMGVAVDVDAGKVWFRFNNGSWENNSGGDPTSGSSSGSETFTAGSLVQPLFAGYGGTFTVYFQESEWTDTAPTDYGEWKTSRLDAPTVTPSGNFNIALYEGDSTAGKEIDTVGFEPDLIWTKARHTNGTSHKVYDSLRGNTKKLETDNATEEGTVTDLNSFGIASNDLGFTLNSGSGSNYTGRDYVAYNWKADQTPPTTYNYSTTLTLTVDDDYSNTDSTGWGDTELEVFEGTKSLGTVGQPTYDSIQGDAETVYEIKTNDASKIKVVWKTVDTSSDGSGGDRFNNIEVVLTDSSSNELASWYPSNYYGGGGEGPDAPEAGDVFRAQTSSADESTTGTLGVQQPTVESNSEKYNAAAGFTMFTYTGNSSTDNDTMLFNHSLGVPIDFAIGKCRDTASDQGGNWVVWHKDLPYDYYSLYLNTGEPATESNNSDSSSGNSVTWFANESTGSQHHVRLRNVQITDYDTGNSDIVRMVDNSKDFVFYGFAGVEGYSKFGKFTGNYDDDGPMVYTGFRPRYLMIKNATSDSTDRGWFLVDSAREPANEMADFLMANSSDDEGTAASNKVDFLSNGFKMRGQGNVTNEDNQTILYIAFAESPFKYSNAK